MALPDDLLKTIADLERRVKNIERNPQPPNIVVTPFQTGGRLLAANSHDTYRITVSTPTNAKLLAIPEVTVYKDVVSNDNEYPYALGWTYAEALNFHIHWWFDESWSDGNNLVMFLNTINNNATSIDVKWRVRFRYLQQGGTTVAV